MTCSPEPLVCVKETLEAILHAQQIAEKTTCTSSCTTFIEELLSPVNPHNKNSIPFILYCKDCTPFKAEGVHIEKEHCTGKKIFSCVSTYIFRISSLKENCAVLELLVFSNTSEPHPNSCCCEDSEEFCSPCCQIDCEEVDELIRTGICINVDLSCICGISCLPAVSLS